jgi:S-adenosylmethionine uptake transporter
MQTLWILLASLLFATMSLLIKLASNDFSFAEIVFFRTFPAALLLIVYARARCLSIRPRHWRMHAIRTGAGIASMVLALYAVSKLPLSTASCLEYTAPLFMMIYVTRLARRRPGTEEALALAGGFIAVVLLLRPSLREGEAIPFLAGLGSGALASVAYLQIRRLGQAGEPPWRMVFVYMVISSVGSAAVMLFTPSSALNGANLLILGGVAVTGLAAQLAMTHAFSTAPPTLVSTLQYSTVGFAALYGYLVWRDTFTVGSGVGMILLMLSSVTASLTIRRTATPTCQRPSTLRE